MPKFPVADPNAVGTTKENCKCYFCRERDPVDDLRFLPRSRGRWIGLHGVCNALVQKQYYRRFKRILDIERSLISSAEKLRSYNQLWQDTETKLNECARRVRKYKRIFKDESEALLGEYGILLEDKHFIEEKINEIASPLSSTTPWVRSA